MNLHFVLRLSLMLTATIALCGCDVGHQGIYRLSLHKEFQYTSTAVPISDGEKQEDKFKQLVNDSLVTRGFKVMAGDPHIWRKRGSSVQIWRTKENALILRVLAFGSKADVRRSRDVERLLIAMLKEKPGVELTRIEPKVAY